eukprot:CAMPEP_0119006808 /NCGR_PEP_ID=MMETSP1176-20130426/2550_1 /TAXON_ID=265551 /ORGANISM="Synedropsis recta cf, Strain CCMP1620" /LENGTH=617 /DNA_ID=CAMNT_0006958807 /DNA_START=96 /DNA_END=1949 /DNA_ORIENTATION=-
MRCTEVYCESTNPTRLTTFETPSPSIAERAKCFGTTLSTPKSHPSRLVSEGTLKDSAASSKFLTPRSRNSVTGRSSLNHSAAKSRSLSRVMDRSSSSQQRVDPEPLCPANIVASRRVLFSPGSKSRKKLPAKEQKQTVPVVAFSSSPTSDKENSGQGKISQRFIDISSVHLREVTKSYSFSALPNEKSVPVDVKKRQSLKVVVAESIKEPNNKTHIFDKRTEWLHQGVAKASSCSEPEKKAGIKPPSVFEQRTQQLHQRNAKRASSVTEPKEGQATTEHITPSVFEERKHQLQQRVSKSSSFAEEEPEVKPDKPSVFEQRTQLLQQRVSKSSSFAEPEEEPEIKLDKPSAFEQRTQLLQQRVVKSNSFAEHEEKPEIKRDEPSAFGRMGGKRALFEQCANQLLQPVAMASSFPEPKEEPEMDSIKPSVFEQRSQWLHQRVAKASSFTEPEEAEVAATTSDTETPKNIVAARTGWFQKQVSMHGLAGDEKLSKKWGSAGEVQRKSDSLLDTPTRLPPRYSTSPKRTNKLLRKAKKMNYVKPKKTLVEERAQWLQNQVCRNELHQDVPSNGEEKRDHDEGDVEQPKSDIELRLEALKREMMADQQQSGVAPKRSLTELP